MVRTYAFNASSRSEDFQQYKHTAATRIFDEPTRGTQLPGLVETRKSNNESRNESPVQSNNNPIQNQISYFPPINQTTNTYHNPFHSPIIDPIGSIVGLRLLYLDGRLVYVPVEPHINFLINTHFGGASSSAVPVMPQIQQVPFQTSFDVEQQQQQQQQYYQQQKPAVDNFQKNDSNQNAPKNTYSNEQSHNYQNTSMITKPYGSMPNLSEKKFLSPQEQHKLELQQQCEDNKRRKELEKQKEIELEQREIRKWEEYQTKIREEEERERAIQKEKAKAFERRNQQIYEQQQIEAASRKRERRQSIQRNSNQNQNISNDSEFRKTSHSFSNESNQDRSLSRLIRQENVTRKMDHNQEPRQSRPDSSQPREIEWWEKKPSWQEKSVSRASAVIPTLRGKPPPRPDSQRSTYDPAASVIEHQTQSRPASRATIQRASSVEAQEEAPIRNTTERRIPPPTTFNIDP